MLLIKLPFSKESFATHLLEKGVDIKHIRNLPADFYIKTISCYLYIKRKQLVNIESPVDSQFSKDEILRGWLPGVIADTDNTKKRILML